MWQRLAILLFLLLSVSLAQAVPTTPTTDFTDNQDGTVTHKITGLTWKRCSEGQTWGGGTCTGTAMTTYTWSQAMALTSTFAGNSDWRLPNVRELSTILELDASNPAINSTIFPNTPASGFCSASVSAGYSSIYAWGVGFTDGYVNYGIKTGVCGPVRLVRGGQTLGLLALSRPTTDYVDNGDGTATHTSTGLTWKRCAEGQTWSSSSCTGTATTTTWAAATALTSTFAGKCDWRLPTQTELRSLVDFTHSVPSINSTIFPNTIASGFWSASAYADNLGSAWSVHFYDGSDYGSSKTNSSHVRLVRSGQSVGTCSPVSLIGVSLSCPATLTANASGSCSTTASYSDDTSKAVSPTWSSSNPAALSVNSSGGLTAGTPGSDTSVTITANYSEGGVSQTAIATVTIKAAVKLTDLSLSCPSTVNAGSSASCSAIATYGDNTSNTVTVNSNWSSSNPSVLSVNSGSLSASNIITDIPVTLTASYTENGVSKTATSIVTVKAAPVTLSSLSISGATGVLSGQTASLSASAIYTNGTSKNVTGNVTWGLIGTGATIDAAGTITAQNVTTDTSVTVTADYTENGVVKTATTKIDVKAMGVLKLLISGTDTVKSGESASYTATVVYSDGSSMPVRNVTWSASGSGASIDSDGKLTASTVIADTTVTLTAIYTEGQVTKTASQTVTIKTAWKPACSGTDANQSEITIGGNSLKKFGESLDVSYCLKGFNSATKFDIYVAVKLPDGNMLFLQTAGFFGSPSFVSYDPKQAAAKYLANTLIPDKSGSLLSMSVLPLELPTGTYTFYAIPVLAGKDVWNGFNWVGDLAKAEVTLSK